MQIIDENIYVSTLNGISQKSINSTNDTTWDLYSVIWK